MGGEDNSVDCGRRRLIVTTAAVGGAAGVTAVVPFVASMLPSERAKAAGAPVEVDISKLPPGQMMVVEWRGTPVWIINRTPDMLQSLKEVGTLVSDPESNVPQQPEYCKNETRSIKPEIMVCVGICTHLGCSPTEKFKTGDTAESGVEDNWHGGFFCPCHGSTFDLAGRVYKSKPAPTNLVVPPHKYLSDTTILVGVGQDGKEA
ncbi:MAG: ubiquinol-cytochrome c reductase iron-sulfur subunit [Sterolibacterium sp.]|nr:ubiquinol-cytochrome c reductase iron-sulfur subunit [Sterolibacterium sp.]